MQNVRGSDDLTPEDLEIALRALGAFQIQLYDKLTNEPEKLDLIQPDIKSTTACIKKLHKLRENMLKAN
jgi:hypothetical protein